MSPYKQDRTPKLQHHPQPFPSLGFIYLFDLVRVYVALVGLELYVRQAALELIEICLLLLPESGIKGMHSHDQARPKICLILVMYVWGEVACVHECSWFL